MATKKVAVAKKTVAKAPAKAPAPKAPKAPKEPKVVITEAKVRLVQFSVRATIPVMVFGNIQPEIVVEAPTIEEAKAFVLPVIEELFNTYVEAPRDGSPKPSFVNKANVTVTEKHVPQGPTGPAAPAPKKEEPKAEAKDEIANAPEATAADLPPEETQMPVNKTPAFQKAETAIASAHSREALDIIEDQIQKSTKLLEEDKPVLYTLILKKRKEF